MKYTIIIFVITGLLGIQPSQVSAENITQTITAGTGSFNTLPGDIIDIPLVYTAYDETMTGVGVTLAFDSKELEFTGFSEQKQEGLLAADAGATPDTQNKDNDSSTDTKASMAWVSIDGSWPGEGELPVTLGVAHFKIIETGDATTKINIVGDAAANSTLADSAVTVTIGEGSVAVSADSKGGGGMVNGSFIFFLLLVLGVKRRFR